MRRSRLSSLGNLAAITLIICINLKYLRNLLHFQTTDFISLCLLDAFFPLVAYACGLIERWVLRFTLGLLAFDLVYLGLATLSMLSRF